MVKLSEKEKIARSRICLPLDGLDTIKEIRERVNELAPFVGLFKIGKETFTRFGPESIKIVQEEGGEVFLDLKYHDIPNTVRGAAKAATEKGVYMFNVHASGGLEMLKAAVAGVEETSTQLKIKKPKIIAVTVLTSIDKKILNEEIGISGEVDAQVLRLALLTQKAGLDGIVCSAADLQFIKDKLPKDFMYVTPGIKGPTTNAGKDQKRVLTPRNAIEDGATILVVGRAITDGATKEERQKAAKAVLEDAAKGL